MNHSLIIILAVVIALAALILLYLLRGRKQHVTFGETAPLARTASPVTPAAPPAIEPAPLPPEGHGLGSEVTAAIEDVVDQFIGLQTHPSTPEPTGDRLTQLKGLGPRAASRLTELGVTRFAQMAEWDETDVAAIDDQMGAFKGRITRDRWVEQARLLAKGDKQAFEDQFGKLGE